MAETKTALTKTHKLDDVEAFHIINRHMPSGDTELRVLAELNRDPWPTTVIVYRERCVDKKDAMAKGVRWLQGALEDNPTITVASERAQRAI